MKKFGQFTLSLFATLLLGVYVVSYRAKVAFVQVGGGSDRAQVFWKTKQESEYTEEKSLFFKTGPGFNRLSAKVPLDVDNIRFDPMTHVGRVYVERICTEILSVEIWCVGANGTLEKTEWNAQVEFGPGNLVVSSGDDPRLSYSINSRSINPAQLVFALILLVLFVLIWSFLSWVIKLKLKITDGLLFLFAFLLVTGFAAREYFFVQKKRQTSIFISSSAPNFIEHLFDQNGQSLSDRVDGNFGVMIDPFTIYRNYPEQQLFGAHTDKNGFRGSDSIPKDRAVALILGGSTAFGWRVADPKDTLDALLNMRSNFHFINMASVSALSLQELSTLTMYGLDFKPKLVVALSGWNDFTLNWFRKQGTGMGYNSFFDEIDSRFQAFFVPKKPNSKIQNANYTPPIFAREKPVVVANAYISYISKAHRIMKASGGKFVLVFQADLGYKKQLTEIEKSALLHRQEYLQTSNEDFLSDYKKYAELVLDFCDKNGIEYVDLGTVSSMIDNPGEIFTDTIHLTPEGNRLVVDEILKKLSI